MNTFSHVPPGFRFHPTDEELVDYYLRKKINSSPIELDVIKDVDLYKIEPWDLQDLCRLGTEEQNDWYFFSHKDKKYPTGTRTNRATAVGFWKATGRDKVIYSSVTRIGMRKTLVFYKGRAPHGQKSDWIMHEYRLDDTTITNQEAGGSNLCDSNQEDGWVVCRVFKKKNYHKALESPQRSLSYSMDSRTPLPSINKDGVLDQLLVHMNSNRSCKQEIESLNNTTMHQPFNSVNGRFYHLPRLENSSITNFDEGLTFKHHATDFLTDARVSRQPTSTNYDSHERLDNWADLERLVATQLNGQVGYGEPNEDFYFPLDHEEQEPSQYRDSTTTSSANQVAYTSETDLWSFLRSSSSSTSADPLCHLSV